LPLKTQFVPDFDRCLFKMASGELMKGRPGKAKLYLVEYGVYLDLKCRCMHHEFPQSSLNIIDGVYVHACN
jgi:hypothetical protein